MHYNVTKRDFKRIMWLQITIAVQMNKQITQLK